MVSTLTTTKDGDWKSKLDKIKNNKVYSTILEGTENIQDVNESSQTELDSHANMPVIGMNAYILSKIGETVDVAPFTPDYKPISVELVDAALKYECPYSGEIKILNIRRGLYVPSMTHNLLPPFMLREAGILSMKFHKFMQPHPQRSTMQSHSKKPIFELPYHCMVHSLIFYQ